MGDGGEQVHLPASRRLFAPLRSLPSTATPWRAGTCPGSPQAAGSSHGCCGCGRNQPSSLSSRNASAAGASASSSSAFPPARAAAARGARHTRPGQRDPAQGRPRPPSGQPRTRRDPAACPACPASTPTAPPAARSAGSPSSRAPPAPPDPSAPRPARWPAARTARPPCPRPPPRPATAADAACPAACAYSGQPPLQRLPQGHRIRRDPVRQVAADAVGKP